MKFVKTELVNACVISALASVTGKTFWEVHEDIKEYWNIDGETNGVSDDCWMPYLSALGYALQDISHEYVPTDSFVENWPIKPFAPAHICFVYSDGPHAVAMDENGRVYDGNGKKFKSLKQYDRVYRIVGIWKVNEPKLTFKKH
jgi:hypothetical protein